MLIEDGANVNLQNLQDDTALSYACIKNHPAIVSLLLEHGADHWSITSKLRGGRNLSLHQGVLDIIRAHAGSQFFSGGDDRCYRADGGYDARIGATGQWRPSAKNACSDRGISARVGSDGDRSPSGRRMLIGGSPGKSSGPPVTKLLPTDEKMRPDEMNDLVAAAGRSRVQQTRLW